MGNEGGKLCCGNGSNNTTDMNNSKKGKNKKGKRQKSIKGLISESEQETNRRKMTDFHEFRNQFSSQDIN